MGRHDRPGRRHTIGQQETAWKTEKRPAKSGSGYTTWIVVI
jgi:hypothetical protein